MMQFLKKLCVARFNSIKVQLEHLCQSAIIRQVQFQFHKGSIRTMLMEISVQKPLRGFNSIKVQLELPRPVKHLIYDSCFNSIKVQLEH